ncbi:MAG: peptidase T [Clostridia bacterium]|nr:peptidase T [Clostridia bacterium]
MLSAAARRLIDYTRFETPSDETNPACPSTEAQKEFAAYLEKELKALGISARTDKNGYVYGKIPSNIENYKGRTVGFIAHMDLSSDAPCRNTVVTVTENYSGGAIPRVGGDLTPEEMPELDRYKGKTIVSTDGNTLLGADDKAGVAEIVTLCEYLLAHPEIPHGDIAIAFTPDEEIGRGADLFDVAYFGADFAYTMDGGALGEVEFETFNAAAAVVSVTGRSIHPGSAKNRMINASRVAFELDAMLPSLARPEHTEGYEGFFHLTDMSGCVEQAELRYILRDHNAALLEEKKELILSAALKLNEKYGADTVKVTLRDQYRNMAEVVTKYPEILELARNAFISLGREPVSYPVRGGTDGATLSFMGLPCPNLGTGSHGHHGRNEFAVSEEMELAVCWMAKKAADTAKL